MVFDGTFFPIAKVEVLAALPRIASSWPCGHPQHDKMIPARTTLMRLGHGSTVDR